MLDQNKSAVEAILAVLNPLILGKTLPAFQCSCGSIHHGTATAVEIWHPGEEYPGQEVEWYMWTVHMSENPSDPGFDYGVGLGRFVPEKKLKELFAAHFPTSLRKE